MSLRPSAQRFVTMLELLDRVERLGGAAEMAVLGIRCSDWLVFDSPIELPDGSLWHEAGYALPSGEQRARFLLKDGRLLETSPDSSSEPNIRPLSDATELNVEVASAIRPDVIESYVGESLLEMDGPAVPAVVADLLAVAWEADSQGRATIFRALAEAHREAPGWIESAARLKGAFERGIGDRARGVQTVSTRALVNMAAGLMPMPPGSRGERVISVLLGMPRDSVKAAALAALMDLDRERLEPFIETLEPLLREASANAHADTRRLAGELQLKLADGSAAWSISRGLESADGHRRAEALAALEGSPQSNFEVLMPKVLDALSDRDPVVREAAVAAIAPQLQSAPAGVWKRVIVTLLAAEDSDLTIAGARFLRQRWQTLRELQPAERGAGHGIVEELEPGPHEGSELWMALRNALDTAPEAGEAKAQLWIDLQRGLEAKVEASAFLTLIHHRSSAMRLVALRELIARPSDRQIVKDALFKNLVELMQGKVAALRLEAARAIMALEYPHADDIVAQLLYEPDAETREAVLALLADMASPARLERARADKEHIDLLYRADELHEPFIRRQWSAALGEMGERSGARVSYLLAALLAQIPADTKDSFLRQCIDEIDALILVRTGGGEDLLALCRRLMEPPDPRPGHAMRLAGQIAAQDMRGFGFLWTCYTTTRGAPAAAAHQALLAMAPLAKSRDVKAELKALLSNAPDPGTRSLLERMLGRRR